jgi:prophage regulatory protein
VTVQVVTTKKDDMPKKPKTRPASTCPTCGHPLILSQDQVLAYMNKLPPRSLIRAKLLIKLMQFSEATLWRKVAKGTFPKPVKLSERITGWRVEDVRSWMADKGLL